MSNVTQQLNETLERILGENGIVRDARWLVGVSGGRDSVALLAILREWGMEDLHVAHLDHGLRGEESAGDATFVEDLAERWGLPFHAEKVDAKAAAEDRQKSLEEAARDLRLDFFRRLQGRLNARGVMVGHQAEDQAETVLFNLLRGSSPGGCCGMEPLTEFEDGLRICRPLLSVRRTVLEEFLKTQDLSWREDSTNRTRHHTRNRLRHEVFPLLNEVMNRDVVPALTRMAEIAQAEEDLMDSLTAGSTLLNLDPLPVRLIVDRPVAIQRRILREWLKRRGADSLDFQKIEQARGLLDPTGGPSKINLAGDFALRRRQMHLHIERQ